MSKILYGSKYDNQHKIHTKRILEGKCIFPFIHNNKVHTKKCIRSKMAIGAPQKLIPRKE